MSVRRSSRSAFGRSTGNDVSGHYKRHYFLFLLFIYFCPAQTKFALDLQVKMCVYQLRADHFTCLIAPVAKLWQMIISLSLLEYWTDPYKCTVAAAWWPLRISFYNNSFTTRLMHVELSSSVDVRMRIFMSYCCCFRLRTNCLITLW